MVLYRQRTKFQTENAYFQHHHLIIYYCMKVCHIQRKQSSLHIFQQNLLFSCFASRSFVRPNKSNLSEGLKIAVKLSKADRYSSLYKHITLLQTNMNESCHVKITPGHVKTQLSLLHTRQQTLNFRFVSYACRASEKKEC